MTMTVKKIWTLTDPNVDVEDAKSIAPPIEIVIEDGEVVINQESDFVSVPQRIFKEFIIAFEAAAKDMEGGK